MLGALDQFREIVAVDFEFNNSENRHPVPLCMVAHEWRSGRKVRLWQSDLPARPPFGTGPDTLFVAYAASAELRCFDALGWPYPQRILDPYTEFGARTSGYDGIGRGLLDALRFYGLPGISKQEKQRGRAMALRGGPYTAGERKFLLDYCETDVEPMRALVEKLLPWILSRPHGLDHAYYRGRHMRAAARMENQGIPIDTTTLHRILNNREQIALDLISNVDRNYGVYDGTRFVMERFEALLARHGITDWPRTPTGQLKLDHDRVFKPMVSTYPWLNDLRELRALLSKLKLGLLTIGDDDRNRTGLRPFASKTGRFQPSNTEFVFGPGAWIRHLIRPIEGRSVAYIDWSLAEFCIAAAKSGDQEMLHVLEVGDFYIEFAIMAGWCPPGATKATHREARDRAKPCVLGLGYGMAVDTLAQRMRVPVHVAQMTLRAFARRFHGYWKWAGGRIDQGLLQGTLETEFGWPVHVTSMTEERTARNFPMQATCAEMLRLAVTLATERGIEVCAPVHDAVLIEADTAHIHDAVEAMRACMDEASKVCLDGFVVETDAEITSWPDRCSDARGAAVWRELQRSLTRIAVR